MNSTTRGVLIGMLWGDGCLKLKRHVQKDGSVNKYVEFVVSHTDKQREYIEHKLERFHSLMGGKKPKLNSRKFTLAGAEHTELRFSRQHKYFKILHRWIYPEGKKKYTRRILDMMSDEGLAYWYQDDGGISKNKNKLTGLITSVEMRLATYCTEEEADIIIEYFKDKYNIETKKRFHKKTSKYYIVWNTTNSKKLELVIKPYIVNSMLYKLPSTWAA